MRESGRCCICGHEYTNYGHNPWPVVNDEHLRCCERCNNTKVIPARIKLISHKFGDNNGTEQSK